MDLGKLSDEDLARLWQQAQAQQNNAAMTHATSSGTNLPDPNLVSLPIVGQGPHAALVASGRTLDKVAEGNYQLMQNANIAAREAMGMPTGEQFQALNRQAGIERAKDESYNKLRENFPISTGMGEALPLAATPVGQGTAAARIAVPAVVSALSGAAEYGTPEQRAVKGGTGLISGGAGGVVGETLARFAMPVRNAMSSPQQAAARAASDKIGAPMLPSQLTDSATLAGIEDMLARYPGSRGVMQGFLDKQKTAVNAKAQEAIGETRPLTSAVMGDAKKNMGAEYDAMRSKISGMPASSPVFDAIDSASNMLSQGSTKGKEGALGMLSELKDKLYNTKQLTPQQYQGWVSDLAAAARDTNNASIKAALKMVGREMDKEARGPLAKQWGELDVRYGNLKTLMKPGMVNDATGDVYAGRLANQIERQAGEAGKTGKTSGPMRDIYEYARSVPRLREGSQTAEREAAASLLQMLLSGPRYVAAKGLTSEGTREYLAKGLLMNPEMSKKLALLAQSGALPLTIGPTNLGLLNFLSQ